MAKIQRMKLNNGIPEGSITRAVAVQLPRSQTTARSSGRQSYLIIFIFVILLVGVFISFSSFGQVSPQNGRGQTPLSVEIQTPPMDKRRTSRVTKKQVSKPQTESIFSSDNPNGWMIFAKNIGRVSSISGNFDATVDDLYVNFQDPMEPGNFTLHCPQYPRNITFQEENSSKCLFFDRYAQMLDVDGLKIKLLTTNITREEFKIVPLCFVTNKRYHHGWRLENLSNISKLQHYQIAKALTTTSFYIVEKLKEDEGQKRK